MWIKTESGSILNSDNLKEIFVPKENRTTVEALAVDELRHTIGISESEDKAKLFLDRLQKQLNINVKEVVI